MAPQLAAAVRPFESAVEGLEAELRLSVPSDVAYIEEAVELVSRHLETSFVDRRTVRFNLRVALTEALANAIIYGNSEDAAKRVVVRALYGEAQRRHLVIDDPASRLRSVRGRDARDGGALTRDQARRLLAVVAEDLERRWSPAAAGCSSSASWWTKSASTLWGTPSA